MEKHELLARLEKSVEGLDEMINSVMMESMASNVDPYSVQNQAGTPVLAPLIISQTSALLMIAALSQ